MSAREDVIKFKEGGRKEGRKEEAWTAYTAVYYYNSSSTVSLCDKKT